MQYNKNQLKRLLKDEIFKFLGNFIEIIFNINQKFLITLMKFDNF